VPTEGGGWIRVDGDNLMPMDTTNAPVKVGSRLNVFVAVVLLQLFIQSR
jgi:hypothetical protein